MPIQPLNDRVVVRRKAAAKETASGIILPGEPEKLNQGTVVAVGPGRRESGEVVPLSVKVGDTVVFGPYSGSNVVKVDGEDLLVMAEAELLGIITQ
jgi:chaperonin GroES